jgi:hypothetical protein
LGTPRALARIQAALRSKDLTTRVEATERLRERKLLTDDQLESIILEALDATTLLNGMTRVLALATQHPSPKVLRKLLTKALTGNDDVRTHAAALAHHLHGGSAEAFDWNNRPLYLPFNARSRAEREQAFRELCALISVDPAEFCRAR